MKESSLLQTLKENNAYWNSKDFHDLYHVELTNGRHSGEYVNLSKINNMQLMRAVFYNSILFEKFQDLKFDCVCGQAYGSISWALMLSEIYGVDYIFTEKEKGASIKRFNLEKYKSILICEDVLTTGKTSLTTAMSIGLSKVNSIFSVVNRSKESELNIGSYTFPIYSCMYINTVEFSKDECPYCKFGSKALRPKDHWDLLVNQYNPVSLSL